VSTDDEQIARVHQRYSAAAQRVAAGGELMDRPADAAPMGAALYDDLDALPARAAAASLGCGNPLAVADIRPGDLVLDLGSGGGLDALLSARRTGPSGKVIGLDMTDGMLTLARAHAAAAGVSNVEFVRGRIERIPLPDDSVDVVISNCVIALSPDKPAVFAEIARVLRPGGHVGITDVIAADDLTAADRDADVECLAGVLTLSDYRAMLAGAGLTAVSVTPTAEIGGKRRSAIVKAQKPAIAITAMTADHAPEVLAIYQAGLDTGDASFQTTAPAWQAWDADHLDAHRLVARTPSGRVIGWAAVAAVSARPVYAGVVEHSVYVDVEFRGHGVGLALLKALIDSTEKAGIWTIQSGVFPENLASLALHQRAGFRVLGTRERIGEHHGRWRDVVFIERRSAVAGAT
jgi:L-amino acid N-acyltransferase YncA/2-polyprenyl-3-methyl-5-hydroxy-6-metoxy-1,4-benzoquinol methylase